MSKFEEQKAKVRPPLPVARERHAELETCAYCPRLCRAACPVSNADPREALTPYGKMTSLLSRHDDASNMLAFACTGCGACTTACRHQNPVGQVLIEGRASLAAVGRAPEVAETIAREHPSRVVRQNKVLDELRADASHSALSSTGLLLGCPALRADPESARRVLRVSAELAGEPVRLVSECCGAVPELAGDPSGADMARERLGRELQGVRRLLVLDPGCLRSVAGERDDLAGGAEPLSLFAWAAGKSSELRRVAEPGVRYGYQAPCWARGTAAEPAAAVLLERLLGQQYVTLPPGCSGGGSLLPLTYPETSRKIAEGRLAEFREHEVDVVVTACASGKRRFDDAKRDVKVVELSTLLWQGLGCP